MVDRRGASVEEERTEEKIEQIKERRLRGLDAPAALTGGHG